MNEILSADFVANDLFDNTHVLTAVDHYTQESLAIEVEQSLGEEDVVAPLCRVDSGSPAVI